MSSGATARRHFRRDTSHLIQFRTRRREDAFVARTDQPWCCAAGRWASKTTLSLSLISSARHPQERDVAGPAWKTRLPHSSLRRGPHRFKGLILALCVRNCKCCHEQLRQRTDGGLKSKRPAICTAGQTKPVSRSTSVWADQLSRNPNATRPGIPIEQSVDARRRMLA